MHPTRLLLLALVPLALTSEHLLAADREPAWVTVPAVRGLTLAAAGSRLARLGLTARAVGTAEGTGRRVVEGQHPAAGARVRRGAQVRLTCAWVGADDAWPGRPGADAKVRVPAVLGLRAGVALDRLQRSGLVGRIVSGDRGRNVLAQDPPAGAVVTRGAQVRLTTTKERGRDAR